MPTYRVTGTLTETAEFIVEASTAEKARLSLLYQWYKISDEPHLDVVSVEPVTDVDAALEDGATLVPGPSKINAAVRAIAEDAQADSLREHLPLEAD